MSFQQKGTQGFVTVLPISSHEYQIEKNGGEQINDGDVVDSPDSTKSFPFTKPTFILCNKPCRIPIEEIYQNNINVKFNSIKSL